MSLMSAMIILVFTWESLLSDHVVLVEVPLVLLVMS